MELIHQMVHQLRDNDKLQLFERPSMNVGYLGLTVTRPPFDKKVVRQAMNHAIDKQSIIDAFFEGRAKVRKTQCRHPFLDITMTLKDMHMTLKKRKNFLAEAGLQMVLKWNYGQCLYHVHTCQMVEKLLKSSRKTLLM